MTSMGKHFVSLNVDGVAEALTVDVDDCDSDDVGEFDDDGEDGGNEDSVEIDVDGNLHVSVDRNAYDLSNYLV